MKCVRGLHAMRAFRGLGFLTAVLLMPAASALAGNLADFEPGPASPNAFTHPEFIWDGFEFYEGPGAVGTGFGNALEGDGDDPIASQDRPGLIVVTPFIIPGLPGGVVDLNESSTTFFDATLDILPLGAATEGFLFSGPTTSTPVLPDSTAVLAQPLAQGAFKLWTTDPDTGVGGETLLLEGFASSAVITGIEGSTTGSTLSAFVTYTGGAIFDAAAPDGVEAISGEFSWSLLDMTSPLGIDGETGRLFPFNANGVGQFSANPGELDAVIPAPAAMPAVLMTLGLASLRRRRTN